MHLFTLSFRSVLGILFLALTPHALKAQTDGVGSSQHFLQGGENVPLDRFTAVGRLGSSIGSCTATLIRDNLVLTAAHCVCTGQTTRTGCVTRANFSFTDVFPSDNPMTPSDESASRTTVTMMGDVTVHPDYAAGGVWLLNDFALLTLDAPASQVVLDVPPIAVERPTRKPVPGDTATLVGYGRTGSNCTTSGGGIKRQADVDVSLVTNATITFNNTTKFSCPGDSGGPALNTAGRVIGVASSADFATNSNYDPTYVAYEWIFGTGRVLRSVGRLTMLRVHEVGSGFGSAVDPIDGEVIVQLDTMPDAAFGFAMRQDDAGAAHFGMLGVLRKAMSGNRTVQLEYVTTGPDNGQLIRVIEVP